MKSIKRTVAITVLSALLMTGFAFAIPFSASAAYDNNYTFSITGTNTTPPGYDHSGVYLYTNTGSSAKTIYWNNYNFRYSKLMIFNSAGRIVECGGDLYSDSSTITGAPQLSVTIPAGGFMVAFGHNNTNLMKAYNVAMEGAMLYNSTMSVIYEMYASYSGSTLTVRYNNPKAASANALRFLFVGNSTTYFNGSPIKFKAMAAAAGIEVDVVYCTVGSSFLEWFADETHSAGKQFRNLLNTQKFDYVVFQDAASANYDRTKPAIDKMMPLVKANGAEALLYMRYSAASTVDQIRTNAIKHHNNYTKIARDLNLVCAPIADAFVHYAEKYNDPTTLYASDGGHHSKEGSYLIAATWLYSFLGVNPVGNTYTADMSATMVQRLQACAKIAVEEGYPYPGQETTYTEGGKTYNNIALEKSYTVNGSVYDGAWTDANKTKYTDGLIAIDGSDTANGCWKGKTVDVTIDLEERFNLKNFRVDMYGNSGWGLVDPANFQVKVSISDDGKNFTDIGTATMGAEKVNGDWKFREFNLATGKDDLAAKYVRLTFSNVGDPNKATNFFWLSEIRVYGEKSANQDVVPQYENLVLNKDYTATAPNRGDSWDDDGVKLTDGVKGKIDVNTVVNGKTYYSGWNATDSTEGLSVELLFDLGSAKKSDTYTAYMVGGNWGIALPKDVISMEVYVSDKADGEFELVASAPLGSAELTNSLNNWNTYTITATANKAVSARYVKMVLTHKAVESDDGKAYIWMDEAEVFNTKVDDDTSEPANTNNVALNKDYEGGAVSPAGPNYSANLTDGNANTTGAFDSTWYAFYYNKDATADKITAPNGLGEVVIDLDEVVDGITDVRVHVWNCNANGILPAKSITLFVSEDGNTYTEIGELDIPNSNDPAWATISTDNISAQYVKIVVETQAVWTFLNEIEVLADPDYDSEPDVSEPDVSEPDVSEPDVSEPTDSNNVALNKEYEATVHGNYTANLTDGVAYDKMAYNNNWFAFYNNGPTQPTNAPDKVGTVIIDLDGSFDISGIKINAVQNEGSGIGMPNAIKVYLSDDGETWGNATELALPDIADTTKDVAFAIEDNVVGTASFVKVEFTLGEKSFVFFNEIEVYGVDAEDDGDVSEPDVSEPDVSEPDVSEPDVSEPDVSEPDVSEPDVSEPEVSEPDVSEPDVSEPDVSEPDVSEPGDGEGDGDGDTEKGELGDIDFDGDVDAADYILVKRSVLRTYELTEDQFDVADIDADGDVDAADYVLVKRIVLGTYTVKQDN